MKKDNLSLKLFKGYLLIIFFMLLCSSAYSQSPCEEDLCVVQFNAGFNEANKVHG